jgi:hypothetical protein
MSPDAYLKYFDDILNGVVVSAPYDDEHYLHYVRMNAARQDRWLKKRELEPSAGEMMSGIQQEMKWILITEPWCGDAAHIFPIIELLAARSSYVNLDIQLRDGVDSEINHYLTNGGKSIPILVVRNTDGEDLFHWGPRPAECQALYQRLKDTEEPFESMKIALQQWYNQDKGMSIQKEITTLLTPYVSKLEIQS